ncbi:UTP--glucose-1-phosphate uridylyltransferase [Myxococcaceae bacterium]|jgi:UTP--glucose-1-phosphate uridylyltransferase|nr:UTP--glucose-1-phosphate uridylyltransferase [Myxococcaceae bacterium]
MAGNDPIGFERCEVKMRAAGMPPLAVEAFRRSFEAAAKGESGLLSRAEIEPIAELPNVGNLSRFRAEGELRLDRAVVIKLNGGLGTSMGMSRAKSLLPVRPGASFLDLIARQVLHLRREHGCRLPLVLMNSFRTRDESLAALARHPGIESDVPLDFVQGRVPRLDPTSFAPISWPADRSLEWCPPGHGDLYVSLRSSGMLDRLLARGYSHAFVSNADNLGAIFDVELLGWVVENTVPFAMEVTERTEADRKGGHLARLRDGRLVLRESAQCPPDEKDDFQDVAKHRFFNTNNLWIDLRALDHVLRERGDVLPLPLIRNEKSIDPDDPASPRCLQIETAMGAALSVIDGARAVRVPRVRFAPVKTTNDLLVLWSDLYDVTAEARVVPSPRRRLAPIEIDLDPAFYAHIDRFTERFSKGAPSLIDCSRLVVRGDVHFGRGVRIVGNVTIEAPAGRSLAIPDGAIVGER